jgi:hypothetical protein
MGTVPIGTGEFLMIHSLVVWMSAPVERSITVSAPHRMAQTSFSTSASIEEVTAELPILAFTFTKNRFPMTLGSDSGWVHVGRQDGPACCQLLADDLGFDAFSQRGEPHFGAYLTLSRVAPLGDRTGGPVGSQGSGRVVGQSAGCGRVVPALGASPGDCLRSRWRVPRPSSRVLTRRPKYSSTSARARTHSRRNAGRPTLGSLPGPEVS